MYKVKVYIQHGYFEYEVATAGAAVAHGEAIMANRTYRHGVDDETVEFHHVYKVKVCGPDLGNSYPDKFCRT